MHARACLYMIEVDRTCIACKIIEIIIQLEPIEYLLFNNSITKQQPVGFYQNPPLVKSLNNWSSAENKSQCIDVYYTDFKSPFDTVLLVKLLNKFKLAQFIW